MRLLNATQDNISFVTDRGDTIAILPGQLSEMFTGTKNMVNAVVKAFGPEKIGIIYDNTREFDEARTVNNSLPYCYPTVEEAKAKLIDKNIDTSKNETNNLELEKDNYMIKELEKEKNEKIFIVHGRNNELKETIARFLETLELTPIILHEQSNQGKTIIEKLESHSDVGFAIVLMTPDDIGYLVNEESSANKYRARQNVVFELGYFIGKLGRPRVVIIVKGDIDILTDIIGVLYIEFENNDWKMKLAKEIKEAGYNIDLNKLIC